MLPSSHSSTPGNVKPSPHTLGRQVGKHASLASVLPSSHSSPATALRTPSPHTTNVQLMSHELDIPPVSQSSPASVSMLPHDSFDWHRLLQPSPDTLLPSSQVSPVE